MEIYFKNLIYYNGGGYRDMGGDNDPIEHNDIIIYYRI